MQPKDLCKVLEKVYALFTGQCTRVHTPAVHRYFIEYLRI